MEAMLVNGNPGVPSYSTTSKRPAIPPEPIGKIIPVSAYPTSHSRTIRYAPNQQSISSQPPIPAGAVISLVEDALEAARADTQRNVTGLGQTTGDIRAGFTIELSRKNIQFIPEEVVDLIKDDIERLAFMYNQITALPPNFMACKNLRYLNLRSNLLQEFPPAICQLSSLEILDLRANKLKRIPTEVGDLSSLKVFSIQFNKIEKLPTCLGDMPILQCVKLEGNPIKYPPPEVLTLEPQDRPSELANENEVDALITTRFKEYLRAQSAIEKSETESGSSSNESPKPVGSIRPLKRAASGRFPVKISPAIGVDGSDLRSPALPKLPLSATSSHHRGLSQHNAALRRPPPSPLTGANGNERNRSNSESILQQTNRKRMGMVTRKTSDLGTVDETMSKRSSHLRGFSHSSALLDRPPSTMLTHRFGKSADSADRTLSIRDGPHIQRLSILPEQKTQTVNPSPIVKAAKGVLYSMYQLHPHIENLLIATRDSTRRSNAEYAFHGAALHLEEFDREVSRAHMVSEQDEEEGVYRTNELLLRLCFTCAMAYYHVCSLLRQNRSQIISNGDSRYIRSLVLLIYGSQAEVRNALESLCVMVVEKKEITEEPLDESVTPTLEHPRPGNRSRSGTVTKHPEIEHTPTSDVPSAASSRSNTMQSTIQSTMPSAEEGEDDRLFDKIYHKISKATEVALEALPAVELWFAKVIEVCRKNPTRAEILDLWNALYEKCGLSIKMAEALQESLSNVKLKDPAFRNQKDFWQLCNTFVKAFVEMALNVKEAKSLDLVPLSLLQALRPVQKSVKAVGLLIEQSPWKFLAAPQTPPAQKVPPPITHAMIEAGIAQNTAAPPTLSLVQSPSNGTAVPAIPATPLSAALGAAAQATIPNVSRPSATTFSGNVFERADSLLSTQSRVNPLNNSHGHVSSLSNQSTGARYHGRNFQ